MSGTKIGIFGAVLKLVDFSLYALKFAAYTLIAMYIWGQIKVGKMPDSEKVREFLQWSDSVMLPFLMYAAAGEALHIVLKPIQKLYEKLYDRELEKIEREYKNHF